MLARGLQKGFGGGTVRLGVGRGGFDVESSHLEGGGSVYHDEWVADRVGGGQELVQVGDRIYTRVYAGGTIAESELKRLGVTKKEVIAYLKSQILQNGDKIRLHKDFYPEPEGDWGYTYKIIDSEEGVPMTTGKECIYYKGQMVFTHIFLLCPVE